MKKLSYFLFPIMFITFFKVNTAAQVADGGSAYISISCDPGKVSGRDANGTLVCVQEVKFYSENGLSLAQAKAKAAENGWTLATAQELTDAFNMLKYSHFAYGTLADGRMAVPIQSNMSSFKKGTNIGVSGGNQGFFYTIKSGTPVVPPSTQTTPTTQSPPVTNNTITLSGNAGDPIVVDQSEGGYYSKEFFKINGIPYEGSQVQKYNQLEAKYKNGIGNIMQDKWDDVNYRPILERALNAYVAEKFPNKYPANNIHLVDYLKSQIQNKDEHCADCMITRYEFVGFFVPEYLKMLRTGSNPALQQQFAEYVSYGLAKANRETLESWKYYSRRTSAQLANEPYIPGFHLNDKARLDPDVLGTNEAYQYNDFASVFIHSAVPLPGKSVDEFKDLGMNGSPFYFNHGELSMLSDFIIPVAAQAFPDEEGVAKEAVNLPNYLSQNLSAEAKALNLLETHLTRYATGIYTGGVVIAGGFTIFLIHAATENAAHVATSLGAVANNAALEAADFARTVIGQKAKAAAQKVATELAKKAVSQGAKIGITNTAKLGTKAIGPLLGNAMAPVAFGVGVFMAGFMPTGGKAIEIAVFEDNLKKDCYVKDRQKNWMAMSDGEKIENFSFLFKMLVIDVNDDYTYLIPGGVADLNEQRRIESEAAVMASQQISKYGALGNAVYGTMDARYNTMTAAYPTGFIRIQNNWNKNHYIHNEHGQIEQGVIEPNWWSSQWKIVPAHDGLVRIQNKWKPDQYLHNQNGKLEVGTIDNNWTSALWKLVPAHSGWVRLQNSWYKDHYIHNQNGKIEVGPIGNNWASALWKLE